MPVNGMTCLSSSTLKRATPPVPPSIKLGGNGFTTKIAVGGEWEVAPITHPMIMSFDGMTHFLHQRLMKFQRNLQLRGLMKHASHLTIKKVVKNIAKCWVKIHSHGYILGDIFLSWLNLPSPPRHVVTLCDANL